MGRTVLQDLWEFMKVNKIPLEKVFSKTLMEKFRYAIADENSLGLIFTS